jgi:hypothetical protein
MRQGIRKAEFSSGVLTVTRKQLASTLCILLTFLINTLWDSSFTWASSESGTRNQDKIRRRRKYLDPRQAASAAARSARAAQQIGGLLVQHLDVVEREFGRHLRQHVDVVGRPHFVELRQQRGAADM